MKIFVTGGTGFIGRPLVAALARAGHEPVVLLRESEPDPQVKGATWVRGNPLEPGPWQEAVGGCEGAINLAGEPIAGRWTGEKKRNIRSSRILTTRNLVAAIPKFSGFRLFSTSAVGVYGDAGETELTEDSPHGSDFLAGVASEWEAEALKAEGVGAKVVITRFGIVLGPNGGALKELETITKSFLDGPVGGGHQWFSWIHRDDLIRAFLFLLERPDLTGPFNFGAPNPVRQLELAHTLGHLLHRPSVARAPGFAVRLVLGEAADLILFSQRMVPSRLKKEGFVWLFPNLENALGNIFNN